MVKIEISENLYEDFIEEKENLDSTLSTIEILNDKKTILKIKKSLDEIKNGKSRTINFDEIDSL